MRQAPGYSGGGGGFEKTPETVGETSSGLDRSTVSVSEGVELRSIFDGGDFRRGVTCCPLVSSSSSSLLFHLPTAGSVVFALSSASVLVEGRSRWEMCLWQDIDSVVSP